MGWKDLGHSHHHQLMDVLPAVDPLQLAGFAAIFSYSFLVSWHCAGMCGPLACSILARRERPSGFASLLYNAGRFMSYVGAGMILGTLSSQITQRSLAWGQIMTRVAGAWLIIWSVLPAIPWQRFTPRLAPRALPYMRQLIQGRSANIQAFTLGLLTIFMPCMTLHPLLLASAGAGSSIAGGLTMLAFFLGTLPVMLTATYMPAMMSRLFPAKGFMAIGRALLVLAGIITIWRTL